MEDLNDTCTLSTELHFIASMFTSIVPSFVPRDLIDKGSSGGPLKRVTGLVYTQQLVLVTIVQNTRYGPVEITTVYL
jgi:hypothetical protein